MAPDEANQPTSIRSSSPRVAYCIVGQARGFTNPLVHLSIVHNAIEPFGGRAQLFFLLKYNNGSMDDVAVLNATVQKLQPTGLKMRSSAEDESQLRASANLSCAWSQQRRVFGITAVDQAECFRMIEADEMHMGRRYDLVIKMRPDEQICSPWPSHGKFNWSWYSSSRTIATWWRPSGDRVIHDHVAIMTRSVADVYFQKEESGAVQRCTAEREVGRDCNSARAGPAYSECFLSHYLRTSGIRFDNGAVMGDETMCLWPSSKARGRCHRCTAPRRPSL